MAGQQWDIEAIVREVCRRLQQLGDASLGGVASAAGTEQHAGTCRTAGESITDARQLRLADRTVTMHQLAGRLEGVNEVLVPPAAVVTPSVRDELRRRQIVLRPAVGPVVDAAHRPGLVLGVAGNADSRGVAVAAVQAEGGLAHRIDGDCVLEVVRQVAQAVAARRQIGLVLTDRPAVALCLANRRTSVRAGWGVSVASVRETLQEIGANLLVLNPAQHGAGELRGMIREFLGGTHNCPEAYRQALGGES